MLSQFFVDNIQCVCCARDLIFDETATVVLSCYTHVFCIYVGFRNRDEVSYQYYPRRPKRVIVVSIATTN